MRQEGVTAVNNGSLPLDFLVLTKRTEASRNKTAIPLKDHAFPYGFFSTLPCFSLWFYLAKRFPWRLRG